MVLYKENPQMTSIRKEKKTTYNLFAYRQEFEYFVVVVIISYYTLTHR